MKPTLALLAAAFLLALLAAAFLLALAAAPAQAASSWRQSKAIDDVASWLAMRNVHVRCLTRLESASDPTIVLWGAAAYVEGWLDLRGRWHPGNHAVFAHGHCEPIEALLAADASAWRVDDIAWAIMVLTHEAGHLRGHRWSADEAKTQCWAIRHVGYVAHRLGVVDEAARRLIVAHALSFHKRLPDEYQLEGCVLPRP